VELLVDVLLEAHLSNAVDIAGSWPEAKPIQYVHDGLVRVGRGGGAGEDGLDAQERRECGAMHEGCCETTHSYLDPRHEGT
jgi:hypothetical protein